MEFVPHIRTRRQFMIEFRAQYELWIPNIHRDRCLKPILKLQAERMVNPGRMEHSTLGNMCADFTEAIGIQLQLI